MTPGDATLLLLAGIGSGLCGSVAGLASLVSYPALLAFGLPPLSANVTNTTAMFATTAGAAAGSRPELRGKRRRLVTLMTQTSVGGAIGAALLLTTPAGAFAAVVPWLVALGALLLLTRDQLRDWAARLRHRRLATADVAITEQRRWLWPAVLVLVGVYAGYFGAGAGIILLAVLSLRDDEPFPVTNAIKNLGTGMANVVATAAYLFLAPVNLTAAATLGAGALLGSWLGPQLVRVISERPLRIAIGLAGLGLAGFLLAQGHL
jgi:uncharacterized membrane protein YfcA